MQLMIDTVTDAFLALSWPTGKRYLCDSRVSYPPSLRAILGQGLLGTDLPDPKLNKQKVVS